MYEDLTKSSAPMRRLDDLPASFADGIRFEKVNDIFYYYLLTPVYVSIMYSTGDTPGIFDRSVCLYPEGACRYTNSLDKPYTAARHIQDHFELMIVLKGSAVKEIEGIEYLYTAGYSCLVNKNIVNREYPVGESTVLALALSDDFVLELIKGSSSRIFPADRLKTSNSIFEFMKENMNADKGKAYLDFSPVYQRIYDDVQADADYANQPGQYATRHLHEISDSIVNTLFFPGIGADYALKYALYSLFEYLDNGRAFHILPVSVQTKNETLIFYRIRQLMEDADGRLTRSQIEKQLHYSGTYLNNIVKQHTGMNITEFGLSFSMEKAAKLLRETDMTIGSILEILHFTNQWHFTSVFKEKYGMTPSEYRRQSQ